MAIEVVDPKRAISEMVTMTGARNDTDLARKLGFGPGDTRLPNIRAGRLRVTPGMMYKLAGLVELPMSEIKRRVGVVE